MFGKEHPGIQDLFCMVLLICFLNGVVVKSYAKRLDRNISSINIAIISFVLTIFCYSYYVGYKVSSLKAIFGITRNAFYFVVMSVIIAVCSGTSWPEEGGCYILR